MPEVKNAFIKSKMNLDLDARLIPQGEYREGNNIQVSKSESADVGALENVLGNQLLADFNVLTSTSANNLQIIGQFTNTNDDTIYIFLTDYTDPNYLTDITFNATAKNYIYSYNVATAASSILVSGSFLNFSTTNLITGVNLIEELLFFTDNRNQPRKINVRLASENVNYYTNEDQISVAKYAPYQPINLYKQTTTTDLSGYETTMYDVVSPTLADNTTQNPYFQGTPNPYNSTYPGDPDYLEDKFVRFSYRFRFDDNEYSVFAPFTQAAYIPKQDGYFLNSDEDKTYRSTIVEFMENKVNEIKLQIPLPLDNSNNPVTGNNLFSYFKIKEIDILYKEDGLQNVQVLNTIEQADFGTANIIEFTYQATKPYKTLPESEIIRVYDKVPVRALSQEIISNRIVYGNFQDKHTPPANLNYNVGVSQKSTFAIPSPSNPVGYTGITEYPNSTVKQNRNYQAGIVLSDRYGRSSTVLLSNSQIQNVIGNDAFDAATIYHNYRTSTESSSLPISTLSGDSIKLLFNDQITSNRTLNSGAPGLYNGDAGSSNYNPLGWYSFKVVIKQTEQEYYNVYSPGIMDGPPNTVTNLNDIAGQVGFVTLFSDNINKIPRDLSLVGPDQKQFRSSEDEFSEDNETLMVSRSSVELFGRVTPINSATPTHNVAFYPNTSTLTSVDNNVTIIGTISDMFGITASAATDLYNSNSDPLIAKFVQIASNPIGSLTSSSSSYAFQLGVFETAPVESLLNIYFETSTTGLISSLNNAILTGNTGLATGLFNYSFSLNEGMSLNSTVANQFAVQTAASAANNDSPVQNSNLTIVNIRNGNNEIIQEGDNGPYFIMTKSNNNGQPLDKNNPATYDNYTIKTARLFYYGPNSNVIDQYSFTYNNDGATLTSTGALQNVAPTITPKPSSISMQVGQTSLNASNSLFSAVNGSADTSPVGGAGITVNKKDLEFSITSQPAGNQFSIDTVTGEITITGTPTGLNNLTIQVKDAGELTDSFTTDVIFGNAAVNSGWGQGTNVAQESLLSAGGSSLAIYWTSDATNSVNTGASVAPILDRTMNAYTGTGNNTLVLSSTLPTSGNYIETKTINTTSGGITYEYANSNYNAIGSAIATTPQSEGGLTRGTGYILVDISIDNDAVSETYTNSLQTSDLLRVQFPITLQYRPAGAAADAWEIAKDIEGNEIRWGSTTQNRYADYTLYPISQNGGLSFEGRLKDATNADAGFGSFVNDPSSTNSSNQSDYLQLNVDTMSILNQDVLSTQGKKIVCVGAAATKDNVKVYSDEVDRFGDYRLIIRYPYGRSNESLNPAPIVPGWPDSVLSGGQLPSNIYSNGSYFIYNIDWGDMYYPYTRTNPSITSYAYQVTTTGANTAKAASALAVGTSGKVTVWAREPFLQYVTQFYTDQALTTIWNPPAWSASTSWRGYNILAGQDFYPQFDGTQTSNVSQSGTNILQQSYGIVGALTPFRIWSANFDSNGLKLKGTAVPSQIDP